MGDVVTNPESVVVGPALTVAFIVTGKPVAGSMISSMVVEAEIGWWLLTAGAASVASHESRLHV